MCNCRKLSFCLGNIIYISEKLATCCALTAVITCLITTLILMLVFGIGLGYNYCIVDIKANGLRESDTSNNLKATKPESLRQRNETLRTSVSHVDETNNPVKNDVNESDYPVESDFPQSLRRDSKIKRKIFENTKTTSGLTSPVIQRTMMVPLRVGVDFSSLLSRIRSLNKNTTLEIIT